MGGSEKYAFALECGDHGRSDPRIIVAKDRRPRGAPVVDVLVAVDVPHSRSACALEEDRKWRTPTAVTLNAPRFYSPCPLQQRLRLACVYCHFHTLQIQHHVPFLIRPCTRCAPALGAGGQSCSRLLPALRAVATL